MTQSQLIEEIEAEQLKKDLPEFAVGDTVSVHFRIIEGDKERVQVFTGVIIARKGKGVSETISVYRIAYGSAMERVFPIHNPKVAKIEVMKRGKVRRSKLYHLRGVFGKKAKIQERIVKQGLTKKEVIASANASAEKEKPQSEPIEEAKPEENNQE